MKRHLLGGLCLALASMPCAWAQDNQLTPDEKNAGWELLFDGQNLAQWRNFKSQTLSSKWQAKDGTLVLTEAGGGDIQTKKAYSNFELQLDWRIAPGGNSGIFFGADESGNAIYSHAPEVQILDDQLAADKNVDSHLSGSLYDLIASPKASHKAAGEWNRVRIRLQQKHLQVWQNEVCTVSIVIGSTTWNHLVAKSKFATWQGFGINESGFIGLQDHGNLVAFRNIKIRELLE